MGTSKSYGGPGSGLLPSFAGDPAEPIEPPEGTPGPDGTPPPEDVPIPVNPDPTVPQVIPPPVIHTKASWKEGVKALGRAVSGGGTANAESWGRASRGYVTALGGSRKAASSSTSGRQTATALGSFLTTAAGSGLAAALNEIGLGNLVGQEVEIVVAELCDVFAPSAQTREDCIARRAIAETLLELLPPFTRDGKELREMVGLSEKQVHAALLVAISTYIYRRWISDFGKQIEKKAITEAHAVRREAEMKRYIKTRVRVTFKDKNVLRINWKGEEGKAYINELYQHAYETLSGQ